eukprot:6221130-Alexandrium_andersonii.AAC.1
MHRLVTAPATAGCCSRRRSGCRTAAGGLGVPACGVSGGSWPCRWVSAQPAAPCCLWCGDLGARATCRALR